MIGGMGEPQTATQQLCLVQSKPSLGRGIGSLPIADQVEYHVLRYRAEIAHSVEERVSTPARFASDPIYSRWLLSRFRFRFFLSGEFEASSVLIGLIVSWCMHDLVSFVCDLFLVELFCMLALRSL